MIGIPWKESETALPRHQDTQLSLLSLMRDFQTELPADSCRCLSCIPFVLGEKSCYEIYTEKNEISYLIEFSFCLRFGKSSSLRRIENA